MAAPTAACDGVAASAAEQAAGVSRAAHAGRHAGPERHLAGEQHRQLGSRAARSAHGPGRRARRGVQHAAADSASSKATRSRICRRRSRSATQNRADWVKLDPEVKCFMPGIPRATYMPYPFQIVQSKDNVIFTYEFTSASRIVRMNTRKRARRRRGWDGRSASGTASRWSIEVTDHMPDTWFDRAGNYHSDALKVTERYTPIDANTLQLRSDDRRSERVLEAVDDQDAALSPPRAEHAAAWNTSACRSPKS